MHYIRCHNLRWLLTKNGGKKIEQNSPVAANASSYYVYVFTTDSATSCPNQFSLNISYKRQWSFSMIGIPTVCPTRIKPFFLKACMSVHHRTIQINHQPDAPIFQLIILTFIYSSTCFGRFPAHHQQLNDCSVSLWFYLRIVVIVVLCSWSGRPEAATAVIELLMMCGKTPETCWAVNKRQDNKLENCCIWLVIFFEILIKITVWVHICVVANVNCSLLQ